MNLLAIKVHSFHQDRSNFYLCCYSPDASVSSLYLVWIFGRSITLAVSRFPQGDPFPSLIKGNHSLHGLIWDETGTQHLRVVLSVLLTLLSKNNVYILSFNTPKLQESDASVRPRLAWQD